MSLSPDVPCKVTFSWYGESVYKKDGTINLKKWNYSVEIDTRTEPYEEAIRFLGTNWFNRQEKHQFFYHVKIIEISIGGISYRAPDHLLSGKDAVGKIKKITAFLLKNRNTVG